jgi:hypothetical protein
MNSDIEVPVAPGADPAGTGTVFVATTNSLITSPEFQTAVRSAEPTLFGTVVVDSTSVISRIASITPPAAVRGGAKGPCSRPGHGPVVPLPCVELTHVLHGSSVCVGQRLWRLHLRAVQAGQSLCGQAEAPPDPHHQAPRQAQRHRRGPGKQRLFILHHIRTGCGMC